MVIILRPYSFANSIRPGTLATAPSSSRIPQRSPTGRSPAITARSTVASVNPVRFNTPPCSATFGTMLPGRRKPSGEAPSAAASITVCERSAADTPTDTCTLSMVTVAVDRDSSRFSQISSATPIFPAISSEIGMVISPLPWLSMKFTASGVANCPATASAPSFSASPSSTTMTIFPCRKSSSASSMVLN